MTPAPQSLHASMAAAAAAVRRHARVAVVALGAAIAALALLAGWLLGNAWSRPSALPLLLDGLLLLGAAALFGYWRRMLRPRLDALTVASAAERRHGLQSGSLRGLLELAGAAPPGTSAALLRREESVLATRLAGKSTRELAGDVGEHWARRARRWGTMAAGGALILVVVGFASPERSRAGWTPLLHPVRQLSRPPLPALELRPGHVAVQRGEPLPVQLRAPGREAVLLRWRLDGDIVQEQPLAVRAGSGRGEIPTITAAGEYWVVAPDGATTPRYRISVTDALLLDQLVVDVLYPDYLALPPEQYQGDVPLLEIPAGTTLRVRGRATRELARVVLQGSRGTVAFRAEGGRFTGRWTPRESGLFAWELRAVDGAAPLVAPAPIEVLLVPDQPPTVELTFPGMDTTLGAELRQPIAADARDDHGLVAATLVSWRAGGDGTRGGPVETPLPLASAGERVLLRGVLDASARNLVPGDTLKYFVRVVDGSPARQSAVSATHSLRLPGAAELRARAAAAARTALERADALNRAAADAERQTRAAQRNAQASNARRAASAGGGGAPGQQAARMEYRDTEQARRAAEQQAALSRELEQLRGGVESLAESATEAGLRDAELQRRLDELNQLLERLAAPGQRQQEALQAAVQQLDPAAMQAALERLAADQQQLKEQLERALEQLRKAAAEQELNALAQEAKELSTQQEALAREHERDQSAEQARGRSEQQAALAKRGEQMAGEMKRLGEQLAEQGEAQAAERAAAAAGQTGDAGERMKDAARSAAERRGSDAAEQGRQAAEQLRQAAESLEATRRSLAEGERQRAEEDMQQATRDALALAQRQHELQLQMERGDGDAESGEGQQLQRPQPPQATQPGQQRSGQGSAGQQAQRGQRQGQEQGGQQGGQRPTAGGGQQPGQQQGGAQGGGARGGSGGQPQPDVAALRAEQSALQQGLEQLGRNLAETGQQSGMVNQEVGSSLNRASTAMQRTQEGLQQAGESGQLPAEQAARAVDALNRLALSLLQNAQQVQQSQNGGGGTAQALQQLMELARQQSSVNGQSSSLQPLGLSPSTTGEQARRLGADQQQIAQQLGGMSSLLGGREDVVGEVDALAKEASALARELQGGRLSPDVRARQERLFHRLLDAGRSLEQEETSEERSAERPGGFTPSAPGALDPRLLESGERYRVPTAEELRGLPPAYRRLILDYFERLNRPPPPPGEGR